MGILSSRIEAASPLFGEDETVGFHSCGNLLAIPPGGMGVLADEGEALAASSRRDKLSPNLELF